MHLFSINLRLLSVTDRKLVIQNCTYLQKFASLLTVILFVRSRSVPVPDRSRFNYRPFQLPFPFRLPFSFLVPCLYPLSFRLFLTFFMIINFFSSLKFQIFQVICMSVKQIQNESFQTYHMKN